LNHKKIVKKRTAKVLRHHAERYIRLGRQEKWRKPKGIDNRFVVAFPEPSVNPRLVMVLIRRPSIYAPGRD